MNSCLRKTWWLHNNWTSYFLQSPSILWITQLMWALALWPIEIIPLTARRWVPSPDIIDRWLKFQHSNYEVTDRAKSCTCRGPCPVVYQANGIKNYAVLSDELRNKFSKEWSLRNSLKTINHEENVWRSQDTIQFRKLVKNSQTLFWIINKNRRLNCVTHS